MIKKYRKGKFYHVVWLDHSTLAYSWTHVDSVNVDNLPCESVGIFIKETKDCIFLGLNRYSENDTFSCVMQILKSCITKSKELK